MEMGSPFGEEYIQKVWLYAFPGTRKFLVCQSHIVCGGVSQMLEHSVYAPVCLV